MSTIIYARVSSAKQEDNYSLESQVEYCQAYADSHKLTVTETIKDVGSGTTINRGGFTRLLSLIDGGGVEAIICLSTDRLTRNLSDMITIRNFLFERRVSLHFVYGGEVENTPEGRFNQNISGSFDEYWKEKIIEGSKRGRLKKVKGGKWVGVGPTPYGYDSVGVREDRILVPNPLEAEVVRNIFQWYVEDISQKNILKKLDGVPTRKGGKWGLST